MNKYLILIIVAVIAIAGTTGGVLLMNKQSSNVKQHADDVSKKANADNSQSSTLTASLQQALVGSGSIECSFTDDSGRKMTSYVKSGMIRSDIVSTNPEESGSVLLKNKVMYFWNAEKVGYTMDLGDFNLEEMSKKSMEDTSSNDQAGQIVSSLEKYKDSCRSATIADSVFTQPSGVTFSDYSDLMKSMNSGAEGQMNQQQLEEMMKKYQNQN